MLQLILADLALLSRSDTPTIISLVGNMVLYVICGLIGALTVAPYKYMWWVASLIFLIIVFPVKICFVFFARFDFRGGFRPPFSPLKLQI